MTIVAEDKLGIVGYIVGAYDTATLEARLEREWWPALRDQYADPAGDPKRAALRSVIRTPCGKIVESHPAHTHMNLMPRPQGQGVGSRLLEH
ncbi:GNAT superfamily N-acetyltransferase [Rhizobium sp. BK196]|uniref:hypothetical protein n=1 Tax=Rhizobium sp. BK196 TaxID=2587073 RepID=UPI00180E906D|nr:GNAT superfamily N-acetyltransferase [Rhizobium sp. BK196]